MAIYYTLTADAWTDLGPVPLFVSRETAQSVMIDYAESDPGNVEGVTLRSDQNCLPLGSGDPRHVWAKAQTSGALVAVIPGYLPN
jgi:hypothetical protein